MKKLLLATSILAGSAGLATAGEITFGGSAFMGLSNEYTGADDFEFIARARISASLKGTTDGGLEFGASFDLHNSAPAGTDQEDQGSAVVFISGGFGKISMGDVGSAADNLVGWVSGVGLDLPGGGYHEFGYYGNQKTALKYEYAKDNWAVALSTGQLTGGGEWSVAGKYTFADSYTVLLGYEETGSGSPLTVLGVEAVFGNYTVKTRVIDSSAFSDLWASISLDAKFNALTLTANYAYWDAVFGVDTYAIGASYDLGGGASFKAGYETLTGFDPIIDMGLKFSF